MSQIVKVGTRRFRIPGESGSIAASSASSSTPLVDVGVDWPVRNKKLAKQLSDYLESEHIEFSIGSDARLQAATDNVEELRAVLEFKKSTFNHAYTHFVSIPLADHLSEAYREFVAEATDLIDLPHRFATKGHKSRLFTRPEKLHLTVLMVTVMSDEVDLERARNIVESSEFGSFSISLSGLDILKGTPEAARVLVARVSPSPELDALGAALRSRFLSAGLSDDRPGSPITWHLTLLNGKYFDRFYRLTGTVFDARKLLRKARFSVGPVPIQAVHLSQLTGSGDGGGGSNDHSGYYHAAAVKMIGC